MMARVLLFILCLATTTSLFAKDNDATKVLLSLDGGGTRAATKLQLRTELGANNYYCFQFMSHEPLDTTDPVVLKEIVEKGKAIAKTGEFKPPIQRLANVIRARASS